MTKKDMSIKFDEILANYKDGEAVNEADRIWLIEYFTQTDKYLKYDFSKIIKGRNPNNLKWGAFWVINKNKEWQVLAKNYQIETDQELEAARNAIKILGKNGKHAHHYGENTFNKIWKEFKLKYPLLPYNVEKINFKKVFKYNTTNEMWKKFHDKKAIIVLVTAEEHRKIHATGENYGEESKSNNQHRKYS